MGLPFLDIGLYKINGQGFGTIFLPGNFHMDCFGIGHGRVVRDGPFDVVQPLSVLVIPGGKEGIIIRQCHELFDSVGYRHTRFGVHPGGGVAGHGIQLHFGDAQDADGKNGNGNKHFY
jgi:hypothetical protein